MKSLLVLLLLAPLAACTGTRRSAEPTDPPDASLFPTKNAAYRSGWQDGFQAGVVEGVTLSEPATPR